MDEPLARNETKSFLLRSTTMTRFRGRRVSPNEKTLVSQSTKDTHGSRAKHSHMRGLPAEKPTRSEPQESGHGTSTARILQGSHVSLTMPPWDTETRICFLPHGFVRPQKKALLACGKTGITSCLGRREESTAASARERRFPRPQTWDGTLGKYGVLIR